MRLALKVCLFRARDFSSLQTAKFHVVVSIVGKVNFSEVDKGLRGYLGNSKLSNLEIDVCMLTGAVFFW
jgi:hypothetical protein